MSRVFSLVLVLAALTATLGLAHAEPVSATEATAQPRSDPRDARVGTEPARIRARRIHALIDGTLDVAIDPASLFVIDLSDPLLVGPGGERLRGLLRQLDQPAPAAKPKPRRARKPPEPSIPLEPAVELAEAFGAYLSLGADDREVILSTHARRQRAAVTEREASSTRLGRLASLTQRAERLEALLAGTLDLEVEPRELLTLDLGDADEPALSTERRQAWATAEPTPTDPLASDPLAQAEARLDTLRLRFLALPPADQAALFETHERRRQQAREAEAIATAAAKAEAEADTKAAAESVQENAALDEAAVQQISDAEEEAEAAASEREQALEVARRAQTEAKRILAEERARLFAIKEAQALYAAELNRRSAERSDNHERALEWSRTVAELEEGLFGARQQAEADNLYGSIRTDLGLTRDRLREELGRVRDAGAEIPRVGAGLDHELSADIDRGEIIELREELRRNEVELAELEQKIVWELAQGLRDDVVLLNRTRLALLKLASPSLHAEVTGFGSHGVDQVRRELDQISVELGFHLLKLPRYGDFLLATLRGSPFEVFVGIVQVLLVGLVLLWWRRHAPGLIARTRLTLLRRRPAPSWASAAIAGLWYGDRIRRPLELLITLWFLFGLAGDLDDLPELMLLWIMVRWILIGQAVILLLDGIAARDSRLLHKASDSSALRIHSLRVVGLNVIAVGLLLGLTSAIVGKGAIYSWVISTCWVLSIPVVLYLVARWRSTIHERLEHLPEHKPFVKWALARPSFATAIAAAIYLFVRGVGSWFLRHLSGLETTRRVLAYLFRREVTKRAAAVSSDERVRPIDAACYGIFDPDRLEPTRVDEAAQAAVDQVAALIDPPRATLSAVVGERGMGKTTLLRRLSDRLEPGRIKIVSCPEIGIEGLLPRIAALTGDATKSGPALVQAVRAMEPRVIAIDDAQRLIQPAIRGLRELDRLIAFAREVGGEISWVITIGASAWHYLQRARGDRVFFEQVVTLPRWTEEQLGALIQSRCDAAGVDPSFDGLVVPRSADTLAGTEEDRTESSYYRLLWDFSRGNPAVALHAFRESLFVGPRGRTVVRLFEEPAAAEIEGLSLPLLFVLRAIVQLDLAREHELVAATQLPATDVSDALRFCQTRGYIEPSDGGVRLTWHWFRTITTVLQRQHLLSTS